MLNYQKILKIQYLTGNFTIHWVDKLSHCWSNEWLCFYRYKSLELLKEYLITNENEIIKQIESFSSEKQV